MLTLVHPNFIETAIHDFNCRMDTSSFDTKQARQEHQHLGMVPLMHVVAYTYSNVCARLIDFDDRELSDLGEGHHHVKFWSCSRLMPDYISATAPST